MSSSSLFYNINTFLSYYGVCLAGVGTVGNMISFGVCMRPSLRKIPTFVFLAFMMLVDTMALYFWNLNIYFLTFYGYTMADVNKETCISSSFLQGFSFQSSAYLLVMIAVERYLSVIVKNWRSVYFKSKHAVLASLVVLLAVFAINIYGTVVLPYSIKPNGTRFGTCYNTNEYRNWRGAHTYIYSIVPFGVLAIVNAMLIAHVIKSSSKTKVNTTTGAKDKRRAMTVSVIVLTLSFFIMTAPSAFLGGYFLTQLLQTQEGRVILYSFGEFGYSYHGINIFILMVSNKKFNSEAKYLLSKLRRDPRAQQTNENSSVTNANTNNLKKSAKQTVEDD